jgi:predicted ATP-grasp superfamily ATP-dependent carboligase
VEVAEHTGAQVVVTLGAMPSQIPHSRMPLVHASSANPELAQRFGLHRPRYQGITGIVGSLQAELDARDYPAISMQVGVPYYAAGAQNWKASAALLRNLEHVTGIPTGHGLLQERVAEWEQLVDEAVAENPEASGYLPQLEAEYDRQAAEQLPSSEDLAAEFERYLRELDDPPS